MPLRARITFKTIDGSTTLFTFNSFAGSNPIKVTYAEMEGAVGENGNFIINVEDSTDIIDGNSLRNCKVYIELGKSEASLQFFMIGYANVYQIARPVTRFKQYSLVGFGSKVRAARLFIHRRMASKIQNIDDTQVKVDKNFNANNLARSSFIDVNWRPLKDQSIRDITGWSYAGISSKVDINIPVVNAPFTYFSDFLDQICAITGAVWFVDYSTGSEILTLSYNPDLHTGITIKSGDLKVPTDDADTTAYIKSSFDVLDEATTEAGHATRVYSSTTIDQTTVSSAFVNKGSSTLDFKALGQQVIIDSDARRLDSLAFVLSKVGEPDSPQSRVNGAIILDVGNKPMGTVLEKFEISISSIETEPQTIFINDISIKESLLEGGQKKIWLVLYQRSGTTGDPQHDPANTIRWHHSGVFNASPVLATYSGSASSGDRDKPLTWSTVNTGPTYTYSVFSNIRRLQARTNKQAAQTYGLSEVFIPTDFLTDPSLISRYLSINLSQMSKARRSLQEFQVWLPNNYLFRPYQVVSFADTLSGVTQDFQVNRARYIISAASGDAQIGTLHADITLAGLFNSLLINCSCS